jgi:glycosyltransferase involved in cell wall biosynthesis
MNGPVPLSLVVITRNEETRLRACVDSVPFADDVLVVDSGSEDGTVALAGSLGCRVIHQDWLGYGPQKRFAVGHALHDWVLCLDADERLSDRLAREMEQLFATERSFKAYEMPRCNRFMGRWLRHGEGYPDWSLRLFDRRHARWSDDPVHERVIADATPGRLSGDLLHESQETLQQYLEKQNRYTTLQAERLFEQGRRVGAGRLLFSPMLRFLKMYLLRRGFLDGVPGLVHVSIGCFNSFLKYAKSLELQLRAAGRGES